MSDGRPSSEYGSAAPPDLLALLESLVRNGVEFIVIGGVAVAHHGYVRATKDLDVVPAPGHANAGALWRTLRELEAHPLALDGLHERELPVSLSEETLRLGGNWDLATKYGRLDLLQFREGALESDADYERLRSTAVPADYGFGELFVIGYEDLIDLKLLAGRDQDLIDVRALREANDDTAP